MTRGIVFALAMLATPAFAQELSTRTEADLAPHVTIRRDTFGVPHILADDDESAAFALGYAEAEDHAVEMGHDYLLARGEGARWFGEGALDNDLAMKRLDNLGGARAALKETGAGYLRWLHGFATGVNLYAAQHRGELPIWFPVVTEADLIAFSHEGAVTGALRMPRGSNGGEGEGEGLAARDDKPGSNALAISGAHTASGKPILLANPHLRWTAQYWEAQITVPGKINFYGSLTVGLPVLRAGFGENIGYAQTNNSPDQVDHYAVPLDPTDSDRYLFKGVSHPFHHTTVSVDVLTASGRMETVTREYLATDFGPVLQRPQGDRVIVSRSEAFDAWRFHEGYYELLFAKDYRSFQAVLDRELIPSSNFTYADGDGNILYLWNARLPKRPKPDADYAGILPGIDDSYFFEGVHPMSQLPRAFNPPSGYVMNSNNPPFFPTVRDRPDPAAFPPYVEHGELGLRPQMALTLLEKLLAKAKRVTPEDVRALKFTDRVLLADRVLPDLFAAAGAAKTKSKDLAEGIAILRAWDRQVTAASKGAVLFTAFWDAYEKAGGGFREPWEEARFIETPRGLSDAAAALSTLEATVAAVRAKYGAANVAWGEVNRYRFGNIDLPGDGAFGGYGVYRVQVFDAPPPDAPDQAHKIAGRPGSGAPIAGGSDEWILLTSFTKPVSAMGILSYGQSSNASSPHSRDQIALFAAHKLRPIWFSEADIRAHTERSYRPGEEAGDVVRSDTIVTEGNPLINLAVRTVKPRGAPIGDPVLLVHDGGAGGIASFDLQGRSFAGELARAGYEVAIMDVRGFERSSAPPAYFGDAAAAPPAVPLAEAAADVKAVIGWLQRFHKSPKITLIGWGAGATWAGAVAAADPQMVGRLVLINALYSPGGAWPKSGLCTGAGASAYRLADGRALRAAFAPANAKTAAEDDAAAEAFVEQALRLDPTSEARKPASVRVPAGFLADACALIGGKRLWDAALVTAPTLVLRGDKDDWSRPEDAEALARAARAKLVTIPGGHMPFLDGPAKDRKAAVDAILTFLKPAG